ncbi:hypothetical protein LXL04_017239 [Taraxacum kok-saghyz]
MYGCNCILSLEEEEKQERGAMILKWAAQSTGDFVEDQKLGEGGFGRVSCKKRVCICIAVKRVFKSSKNHIIDLRHNSTSDVLGKSFITKTNIPKESTIQQDAKVFKINIKLQIMSTFMASYMSHLINYFLLILIPYKASITFIFSDIRPKNQNLDIVAECDGAYISDSGIQVTPSWISFDRSQIDGDLEEWNTTNGEN